MCTWNYLNLNFLPLSIVDFKSSVNCAPEPLDSLLTNRCEWTQTPHVQVCAILSWGCMDAALWEFGPMAAFERACPKLQGRLVKG